MLKIVIIYWRIVNKNYIQIVGDLQNVLHTKIVSTQRTRHLVRYVTHNVALFTRGDVALKRDFTEHSSWDKKINCEFTIYI